jgi:hypothetical protein
MKKYILVIDTSASSPESSLYVHETRTIKEAKAKLNELNLRFGCGYIYCANIAVKEKGRKNNYYWDVIRTGDGIRWHKEEGEPYNPENWLRLHEWANLNYFKTAA